MYKLVFSDLSARILEKVYRSDRALYCRLIAAMDSLKIDPYQGKKLKGQFSADYSLRVGDYRIIYTVREHILTIFIIDLGHRREIYR